MSVQNRYSKVSNDENAEASLVNHGLHAKKSSATRLAILFMLICAAGMVALNNYSQQSSHITDGVTIKPNLSYRNCPHRPEWFEYGAPPPQKCFNFNLMLLKGQKTGSSTSGGVARRIAARFGLGCVSCSAKGVWDSEPNVIAPHIPHAVRHVESRKRRLSTFSFGMMRHPISRCLSEFYHFIVSRQNKAATLANMKSATNRLCKDHLTEYYDLEEFYDKIDFVGTVERYIESLLLLGYELGVTMGDLLYTKAKDSSKQVKDVTGKKNVNLARHVPIDEQPQEIQDFFHGPFLDLNKRDLFFWKKANDDMDARIERIGREKFETKVIDFKRHLKAIDNECSAYDSEGNMKDGIKCYWRDNGCNYPCFDQYAIDHGLWDETLTF